MEESREGPDEKISECNSYLSGEIEVNSDDSENFRQILVIQKEMRQQKQTKRGSKLPEEIGHLMGEANQLFINSHFDEAIQKLYEIIRKYPNFPEPFNLLGLISEERGDYKKSAHFFRLAAEMSHSKELWAKIGYLYKQTGQYEQASICFGRALKSDPLNSQLIQERAICCENYQDYKKSALFYDKLSKMFSGNKELVKKTAKMYARSGQHQVAIGRLRSFIDEEGGLDVNLVHMVVELYLFQGDYQHCQAFMDQHISIKQYENLPMQLVLKYAECLIKGAGPQETLKRVVQVVIARTHAPEVCLESVLQLGQQLGQLSQLELCRDVYEQVMSQEERLSREQLYQTYQHLGRVYQQLHDDQSAIDAYQAAIELQTPDGPKANFDARMSLSELYQRLGRIDQALDVLRIESFQPPIQHITQHLANQKYNSHHQLPSQNISSSLFISEDQPQKKVKVEKHESLEESERPTEEWSGIEGEIRREVEELNRQIQEQEYKVVLQKGELLLQQNRKQDYVENSLETVMSILQQEYMVQLLEEKVLNLYYNQSYKRSFLLASPALLKRAAIIQTRKQPSAKQIHFQKKKIKQSQKLTRLQMNKVKYFSRTEGVPRLLEIVGRMSEVLVEGGQHQANLQLMLYLTRLDLLAFPQKLTFLLQGLRSSIATSSYDLGFHFIKKLLKVHKNQPKDNLRFFLTVMLSQMVKNVEEQRTTRSYILKMGKKVQEKGGPEEQVQWAFIQANSYLQSGYFELATRLYYGLHQHSPTNPLLALQLANSYLQESLGRTQLQKERTLRRSFYFLRLYSSLRLAAADDQVQAQLEVNYNQGKCLALVGYLHQAACAFRRVYQLFQRHPSPCHEPVFNKTVYNLIIIYGQLNETGLALEMLSSFR